MVTLILFRSISIKFNVTTYTLYRGEDPAISLCSNLQEPLIRTFSSIPSILVIILGALQRITLSYRQSIDGPVWSQNFH